MPFDPRVVADDDFDSFPDDEQLDALGAQLLDDARQLADVYPACSNVPTGLEIGLLETSKNKLETSKNKVVQSIAWRPRLAWLSLACGLLLIGAFVWQTKQFRTSTQASPAPTVVQTNPPAPLPILPSPTLAPTPTPTLTPLVQQNLTGPEWEAVLDLLESETGTEQTVSL